MSSRRPSTSSRRPGDRDDRRESGRRRRGRPARASRCPRRTGRRSPARTAASAATVSDVSASAIAEPARTSRVGPAAPPADSASTSPAAARPPTNASPPAGSDRQREPERGDGDHGEVRAGVDGEGVGRGQRVAGQRLQRGAGDAQRERRRRAPASRRGSREATSTRAASSSSPPSREAEQVERRRPSVVPWVRCTAATTSTASTATASATAIRTCRAGGGPDRGRGGPARPAPAGRGDRPGSARVRLDERVDVLLAGLRAAERPDAVGQLVHLASPGRTAATSRSRCRPRPSANDVVAVGGVVEEVQVLVLERRQALDVGLAEAPLRVDLAGPRVLQAELDRRAGRPARPGRTSGWRPCCPPSSRRPSRSAARRRRRRRSSPCRRRPRRRSRRAASRPRSALPTAVAISVEVVAACGRGCGRRRCPGDQHRHELLQLADQRRVRARPPSPRGRAAGRRSRRRSARRGCRRP